MKPVGNRADMRGGQAQETEMSLVHLRFWERPC